MKILAQLPDVESLVWPSLADLLEAQGETVTCGLGVPTGWTPASVPHVEVTSDGTPVIQWPMARATIRVLVRASTTGEAKRLASLTQGLLLGPVIPGVSSVLPGVGPNPTRDDETGAELAWFTVRATVKADLIEPVGS